MDIHKELLSLRDDGYADFQSKLVPYVDREKIIGVRVPALRKLAKACVKDGSYAGFLGELPHEYYDEDMLHGIIISELKDRDECLAELERFLPYVDNWAVCDVISAKALGKNRELLLGRIKVWSESDDVYTCRFGLEMLMTYFLDDGFEPAYFEIPARVRMDEYYVKMMIAWFFATALAKQWDDAIVYIEDGRLDMWTHNKAIQKARESYRITAEQKEYLKTLKMKNI